MTTAPEWTYRHADQVRNHWWWRPGWHVGTRFYAWHITFTGAAALHRLVDQYQSELAYVDGLDLIPREWLHLTMQGVGHVADMSSERVRSMVSAAQERVSRLSPITVTFHRPVIRSEAVVLPPSPLEPLQELRTTVRSAMTDILGANAVPEPAEGFEPHVSLAYVNTDQPARAARAATERVQPAPAQVTIAAASLIRMHRDRRMYEWTTESAAPLRG